MATRVAINGFGRIGRTITRSIFGRGSNTDLELVAINDLTDVETLSHLFRLDSVHGRFDGTCEISDGNIVINGNTIEISAERDPSELPWDELDIDVVLECTGVFRERDKAAQHLEAGASKVIISAPGKGVDKTIVLGVNEDDINSDDTIISCGSCTTNCLAPLAKVLNDGVGIESGTMTTVHAYTSNQNILDAPHKDLRRARAAGVSMIPTSTGAAVAVSLVLPELEGKLDGMAIRVPTPNVSLVDLTFKAGRDTSADEINQLMRDAAEGPLDGVLGYETDELVSIDLNGDPRSSIFDSELTKVQGGDIVKVLSWYDNESGFSNRMVDLAELFGAQ